MATLVFIDTNVFLDFYRLENREAGLSTLEKIENHRAAIITGDQVSMEFKKNRQKVILDVYGKLRAPDWGTMQPPPVLAESQPSRTLETHKRGVKRQAERLKKRLQAVLTNPGRYDPVYRTVQRLVCHRGPYNLSRDKKIRFDIRDLAQKRFTLGYPPRKAGDTSIGDAINWEWVLHCANESGAGIVIVTRDTDYGPAVDGRPVLNDWLREEFKERVGRQRKLLLTDRLSIGFKEADIAVSKKEKEAESALMDLAKSPPRDATGPGLMRIVSYSQLSADPLLLKEELPSAQHP